MSIGKRRDREKVEKLIDEYFSKDVRKERLHRFFCHGFDSLEDYEKYGDMFVHMKLPKEKKDDK